jgi:hypothetical protein
VYGALAVITVGSVLHVIPGPPPGEPATTAPVPAKTAAAFHHIVLPDLAVIQGSGLSDASVARIGAIHGVRQVLALDGAKITSEGTQVNVIGVNAQQFRAWTPLSTASNEKLWNALDAGGFIASPSAKRALGLHNGIAYPLTGAATIGMQFAGAAPLGVAGIDLVVSSRFSARLGLIHNVAALISAPGMTIAKLTRTVKAALSSGAASLVPLRPQAPVLKPAQVNTGKRPTNYIELFQESAALYCPGLPWTVLAAIGQIESGDGANMGPSTAGALGPMQFLPSTWAAWGITAFGEQGPPNVMDPFDAVPSAARYLCAAGGATSAGLPRAIFAYNHATWYVNEVLALAQQYAQAYG